ncbi:response regulator [Pelotalea chapellei]|uniref:histidine kinase n=1 Tax=Pelotalea chapellei TaxID=44671 RepID=A0ABS5U6C5_9BACT|nr:response regulator [Pelotalea chapellei]MBT1071214.1 response regulator [Pelotalea chapellei]
MNSSPAKTHIKVLYVEDETTTREQLGRMISLKGFQLITAENGKVGLELYRNNSIDIVLTDIMMPIMTGLELAREIRKEDPNAQIIVLTAYNDNDFLLDAIDIGITQFVLKPVQLDKLFAAMEKSKENILLHRLLKEQHDHIRMLSDALEQSPSITMITDTQGNIEYVNKKFCEVTGYTTHEILGVNARILSGQTPVSTYTELWDTIRNGKEWHGTLYNRRKDGTLYWEYCGITPFNLPDGTGSKYIKTAEDVTERRRLEAEILQARHLQSLGVLAGGLAHDFNNLLQIILGSISLAKMKSEPESTVHGILDMAEKSSEEARALGRRLLELTREGDSTRHALSLAPLITAGLDEALDGTTIIQELNLPQDLPKLALNGHQIQHVFYHLALNARESMPEGGTLRVSAEPFIVPQATDLPLQPGRYVHIVFSDTGRGIPNDQLDKIFDPYFSTKAMGCRKGQGLGLSICHAVVLHHGGSITVKTNPGEGTTFHLWLPIAGTETT